MSTPARTSGDQREDAAIAAGRKARAILDAAELDILAAMARYLRQAAAGSLTPRAASGKLRMTVSAQLGAAMRKIQPLLALLPLRIVQDIKAAFLAAAHAVMAAFTSALNALAAPQPGSAPPQQPAPAQAAPPPGLTAAQKILTGLAVAGIPAVPVAGGRVFRLATWVALTIRAAMSAALLSRAVAAIRAAGGDEVLIGGPAGGKTCPKCEPWAGRVITLAEMTRATAEGLYHVNCRHFPVMWREGMNAAEYMTERKRAGSYAAQQRANYRRRQATAARRLAAVNRALRLRAA